MRENQGDRSTPGDGAVGFFTYRPIEGSFSGMEADPVVRTVHLKADEHAGPFWDDEGHISDDYEELNRWIGISRELFDDIVAWNEEFSAVSMSALAAPDAQWQTHHAAEKRALVSRLRHEVHRGIVVPE